MGIILPATQDRRQRFDLRQRAIDEFSWKGTGVRVAMEQKIGLRFYQTAPIR